MNLDDITADLPAPRDDEPESLRRDIADELIDHLQSSLQRELHRATTFDSQARSRESQRAAPSRDRQGADVGHHGHFNTSGGRESAEQSPVPAAAARVLARFDDPSAIARTLWWDAMQEKIMTQRLILVMASTAAAACIAGCVLLWQMTQQQASAQAAALAGQQSLLQSLVDQMGVLKDQVSDPRHAGWAPVSVRLVSEDGTAPVQGSAKIFGGPFETNYTHKFIREVETDASGRIDFQSLHYGLYQLRIETSVSGMTMSRSLLIGPDGDSDVEVRCPSVPPAEVTLRFKFEPLQQNSWVNSGSGSLPSV